MLIVMSLEPTFFKLLLLLPCWTFSSVTQENSIKILNKEIKFYRKNQALIEGDLKRHIEDNNKLSQQVEILLRERGTSASCVTQCSNCYHLLAKIDVLTKENKSFHELWQTSQRAVEVLDSELKAYQNLYSQDDTKLANRKDLIVKFETSLEQINELEIKLQEATKINKDLLHDLKASKSNVKSLEEKLNNINKDLEEHQNRLKLEEKRIAELIDQLEKCNLYLETSLKREAEAKFKVQEAVELFDIMITHKDEAVTKLAIVKEELALLKANTNNISAEIESRLRAELDDIKEKYDEKIADMLRHMQTIDAEIVEKGVQLLTLKREDKILKETIRSFEKQQARNLSSVEPRVAIAEKRLEAVFKELVLSERRNISLVSEKHCLALDCQRRRDTHERDMRRREWEISLMKTEIADCKMQIGHLQKSLAEADKMIEKLQNIISSRNRPTIKVISGKDEEIKALDEHIHNQMEINKKWRQSYINMTDKLQHRLEELNEENKLLKSQNTTGYLDDSGIASNITVS